jgi:peptidoglycan hydrolase-like protein with peptidoglycan-binding domain
MEILRQGSRGKLVDLAQTLLNDAFYASNGTGDTLEQDGIFGPRTAARLQQFIGERLGISAPAVVDDRVWRALGVQTWVEHQTQLVAQHTDMLCWNAAAAMTLGVVQSMTSGGAALSPGASQLHRPAGRQRVDGLVVDAANIAQFLRAVNLTPVPPPADGPALARIVSQRRLWLAGRASGGVGGASHHAVCVSGVIQARYSPTSSMRVLCRMHDPWPPTPSGGGRGGTVRWQYYFMPQMYFGSLLFAPLFAGM